MAVKKTQEVRFDGETSTTGPSMASIFMPLKMIAMKVILNLQYLDPIVETFVCPP